MKSLNWDDIRFFLEVTRAGSLVGASRVLKVNHTTVARRVSALEENLDTKLFYRSDGRWNLTSSGQKIYETSIEMAEQALQIHRHAISETEDMQGTVKVTSGTGAFQSFLISSIAKVQEKYPKITLELIASQDVLNLDARDADIAVRFGVTPPKNVIAKRIAKINYSVYGTPKFRNALKNKPKTSDVPIITWINEESNNPEWIDQIAPNANRIIRVDEFWVMTTYTRAGLGIAYLPCIVCDNVPELVKITPEVFKSDVSVWVLSHVDLRTTARVRIVRDEIVSELSKLKNQFEAAY